MSVNTNTTYPPATGYPQQPESIGLPPEMPPPYFQGAGQPTATGFPAFSTQTGDLPYAPQPYPTQKSYSTQEQGQAPFPEMSLPPYPKNPPYVPVYDANQEPTMGNGTYISSSGDTEMIVVEKEDIWTSFSEKAIRNAFIRKVYAILVLQLTFTVGIVCLFVFEKNVNKFVQENKNSSLTAYITFTVVYIALEFCGDWRRKFPTNIILLSIFTMAMAYFVGALSSQLDTKVVLISLGISGVCCLGISIFSCFTKFDLISIWGVVCVFSWLLVIFGIIAVSTYKIYPILNTVYAGLATLVFMVLLGINTQRVMGGKEYELSPEEYICAALQLYLDIIWIILSLYRVLKRWPLYVVKLC